MRMDVDTGSTMCHLDFADYSDMELSVGIIGLFIYKWLFIKPVLVF